MIATLHLPTMQSPYKLATDSPSRQLLWELNEVTIAGQRGHYAHLDQQDARKAARDRQALANAAARHEKVRRDAEQYREQLLLQEQAEAQRRDEEQQRELERLRRENAELEKVARRREIEYAQAAQEQERRRSQAKKAEAEAAEARKAAKAKQDAEEAQRRQQEEQRQAEERRKAAAISESRAKEVVATPKIPQNVPLTQASNSLTQQATQSSNSFTQQAITPGNPQWEQEHQRFLDIHQNLKQLRAGMSKQAQGNPELKKNMGDWRRSIRKSVGQMREGKGANKVPVCS